MTISPPTYRVIPSSEDRAHHSTIHEAGEDGFHSTSGWIPAKDQTKWTYFLLGCAILLPWTAVVNGMPFFLSRLADSPFYPTFGSYLSSVYMLTKMVCQFYCTITSKQSSPSRRIFVSIITMLLFVASLCLSTFIRGTSSTFFAFALFTSASLAAAAGCLCTAVYASAALLGPSYLQSVFLGQGAIMAVTSIVQVASSVISIWGLSPRSLSMAAVGPDRDPDQPEELAARIFFGVSAIFLCIPLVAYTRLTKQPFYASFISTPEHHREVDGTDGLTRLVARDHRNPTLINPGVFRVFQENFIFMFSIAHVFIVTLALFPAITARVQSVDPDIHPLLFTSVHCLVYSIGDLAGRHRYWFLRLDFWSADKILALSLLRTLFIPLILLCNIYRPTSTSPASPLIDSDIVFMAIMLALGFTTGYVFSLAMLVVSSLEHNPRLKGRREDVNAAAALGGSFTIVGLAMGTLCSFGVQAMI